MRFTSRAGRYSTDACPYVNNGTHVHAQPAIGVGGECDRQNSAGSAKMTGATNSAFGLLALGSGFDAVLIGNEIVGKWRYWTRTRSGLCPDEAAGLVGFIPVPWGM